MINEITSILKTCHSSQTNINPTLLYNEGWMIRLLVSLSIEQNINIYGIEFKNINHWFSEGLLSSPFLARYRGDNLAEGYTHADITLGDFDINSAERGDIKIRGRSGFFGVIEAKMGSPLSSGTTNAPNYNQASRNLACIAFNALETEHQLFFAVAAPAKKIKQHEIDKQLEKKKMLTQIANRFDMYDKGSKVYE